jgi:hypothetical protein
MKHIKTFEELDQDFGRFSNDAEYKEEDFDQVYNQEEEKEVEDCDTCDDDYNELGQREDDYGDSDEEEEEEEEGEEHDWNDHEVVESRILKFDEISEKKKVNPGFQAYLDKQKAKKDGKETKETKGGKKAKPDFLDLDKDGDKKETMKKAAADKKGDEKGTTKKGLSAAQKKLPKALQDAILKKQK